MAKFFFTNKAVHDLNEIWNYTLAKWSLKQAEKYYNYLIEQCNNLAINPNLGKEYQEILSGLYGYRANRHIIFYRIVDDTNIEITRILHGRMDLKKRHNS